MAFGFGTKKRIYLDWASAAPVKSRAAAAFTKANSFFGNPSSAHEEGRKAREMLEESRTQIARLIGVKSPSLIFTSGATEANNMALQGRVERCRQEGVPYERMHILYVPTMHASVRSTAALLSEKGVVVEEISLQGFAIDYGELAKRIRPETILVSADAVCGETGVRFDTLRIKRLLDGHPHAVLHVDASQLPLVEQIERTRLGADMLVLDAQKVGGVRGIGALALSHTKIIAPLMQGGGQEQGLRPGTEPVALAAAFAEALTECNEEYEAFSLQADSDKAELIRTLTTTVPGIVFNEGTHQVPHMLNISFPGLDTDYAQVLLDRDGFAVSTKSACETDSEEGSRAVQHYTGDSERATATLRISWGPTVRTKDLQRFAHGLREITTFLRNN